MTIVYATADDGEEIEIHVTQPKSIISTAANPSGATNNRTPSAKTSDGRLVQKIENNQWRVYENQFVTENWKIASESDEN